MTPIRDGSGEVIGFIKIGRDLSQRRQAEEALLAERRLLGILNRAGSALAIETDLEKLVQIVTDAGVELTGAQFGAFSPGRRRSELHALHIVRSALGGVFELPDAAQYGSVRTDLQRRGRRPIGRHHKESALRQERSTQRHAGRPSAGAKLSRCAGRQPLRRNHWRPAFRS
jgi:PAS domain-containing protein